MTCLPLLKSNTICSVFFWFNFFKFFSVQLPCYFEMLIFYNLIMSWNVGWNLILESDELDAVRSNPNICKVDISRICQICPLGAHCQHCHWRGEVLQHTKCTPLQSRSWKIPDRRDLASPFDPHVSVFKDGGMTGMREALTPLLMKL